jgi:ubiquinone biosynthesis monooxygenase Coq7
MQLIRAGRPFPTWLQEEMRSNHAGETGAVEIYNGALWALRVRSKLANFCSLPAEVRSKLAGSLPQLVKAAAGQAGPGGGAELSYDQRLAAFADEHRASEQHHLDLLEEILEPSERSRLLPGWVLAGRGLGAVSTIWCARGMYLTTAAVEEFVESHYRHQIARLAADAQHAGHAPSAELRRMLQHCCEDEVHHKEEGLRRAAEGPQPWFGAVDLGLGRIVALYYRSSTSYQNR